MKYQIEEINADQIKFCNQAKLINCEIHKQRLTSFETSGIGNIQDRYVCEDCPKKNKTFLSFKEAEEMFVDKWNENARTFNKFISQLNLEQQINNLKRNLKNLETQIKATVNNQINKLNQLLEEFEKRTLTEIKWTQENLAMYHLVQKLKQQKNDIVRQDLQEVYLYIQQKQQIKINEKFFIQIKEKLSIFQKEIQPYQYQSKESIQVQNPILNIAVSQDSSLISLITYSNPPMLSKKDLECNLVLYKNLEFNSSIAKRKIQNLSTNQQIQSYQVKFSKNNQHIAVHQMIGLQCFEVNNLKEDDLFSIEMTKLSQFLFSNDSQYLIVMFQEEDKNTSSLQIIKLCQNPEKQVIKLDGISSHMSANQKKGTVAVLINKQLIHIYEQKMNQQNKLPLLNICNIGDKLKLFKIEFDQTCKYLISCNSQKLLLWDADQLLNSEPTPIKEVQLSNIMQVQENNIIETCSISSDEKYFYISVAIDFENHKIIIFNAQDLVQQQVILSQLRLEGLNKFHQQSIIANKNQPRRPQQFFNAQIFIVASKFKKLVVLKDQNLQIYTLRRYISDQQQLQNLYQLK